MTDVIPRLAVVPTHNRPAELARLIEAVAPQCDRIIVIDNASSPPVRRWEIDEWPAGRSGEPNSCWIKVVHDDEQPPNLSRLWNVGLNMIGQLCREVPAYDIAVLNDDAVPPPGWWDNVSAAMRMHGAVAGSSDPSDQLPRGAVRVWHADAPMSVATRLAGWAMLLRGEWDGARFDERLRWWYGEDEISLRARQAGGLVHVGGFPVENTGANTSTVGVLAEQAGRDRQTFIDITGRQPW